jgi:hypothetical protein
VGAAAAHALCNKFGCGFEGRVVGGAPVVDVGARKQDRQGMRAGQPLEFERAPWCTAAHGSSVRLDQWCLPVSASSVGDLCRSGVVQTLSSTA